MDLQGEIRVLGEVAANVTSGDPLVFQGNRSRELLAALSVSPGTCLRREELCGRIWPDANELGARKALNTELWRLRSAIREAGGDSDQWIESRQNYIRICPENGIVTDLSRMQSVLDAENAVGLEQMLYAVELYRGDFALDVSAEWIEEQREFVRRSYYELLELSVLALGKAEMFSKAFSYAERLIRENPYDERARRTLLMVQIESGDKAAAVQHYREFEALLDKELGIKPSVETRELLISQNVDLDATSNFSITHENLWSNRSIAITRYKVSRLRKSAKELLTLIDEIGRELDR